MPSKLILEFEILCKGVDSVLTDVGYVISLLLLSDYV
jgi:hypothetical protein